MGAPVFLRVFLWVPLLPTLSRHLWTGLCSGLSLASLHPLSWILRSMSDCHYPDKTFCGISWPLWEIQVSSCHSGPSKLLAPATAGLSGLATQGSLHTPYTPYATHTPWMLINTHPPCTPHLHPCSPPIPGTQYTPYTPRATLHIPQVPHTHVYAIHTLYTVHTQHIPCTPTTPHHGPHAPQSYTPDASHMS